MTNHGHCIHVHSICNHEMWRSLTHVLFTHEHLCNFIPYPTIVSPNCTMKWGILKNKSSEPFWNLSKNGQHYLYINVTNHGHYNLLLRLFIKQFLVFYVSTLKSFWSKLWRPPKILCSFLRLICCIFIQYHLLD